MESPLVQDIEQALTKLRLSIISRNTFKTNLSYWSIFIRTRDGKRCVLCDSHKNLTAHHIVRKSFMPEVALQTGNGITLCRCCHKKFHEGFNGKPDVNLPMDMEGGEKIEIMSGLFGVLFEDALRRKLLSDRYYFISAQVISKFKMFQGYDWDFDVPGYKIEQAYKVWNGSPGQIVEVLAKLNGFEVERNSLFGSGGVSVTSD